MSDRIWYYALDNAEQGPVGEPQLAALVADGTVGPTTLVWTDGMTDWQEASLVLPAHVRSPAWAGAAPAPVPPVPAAPAGEAAGQVIAQPAPGGYGGDFTPGAHPTDFASAVKACFSRYATFTGRARRPEFWFFTLFCFISSLVLSFIDVTIFGFASDFTPLSSLFSLAILIPSLAVGARRLHDTGRSGWWQLIALIPLVGWILLIVWFASKGEERPNAYGPA